MEYCVSMTLKGIARSWFGMLKPRTIDSFEELVKQLLTQFMANQKRRKLAKYLLSIK